MLKLFILENLPAFAADAVYKICLSLEKYGLTDDKVFTFENYDELFDSALRALEGGEDVIIAADSADYNGVKREIIGKFLLDGYSSPNIAERISQNADDSTTSVDMESECLIPHGALFHLSADGISSGFSCAVLSGRLTYLPLDFVRVDAILEDYVSTVLEAAQESAEQSEPESEQEQPEAEEADEQPQGFDFAPSVGAMVSALIQLSKTAALATGEAAMQVYNLYDKIDGLSDVVNFVEIVDEDEDNTEDNELSESESVKTIRHAREAMFNTQSDFGAAISDILTSENEDGTKNYFAYIAVAEKKRAKAKKINTTNPNDIELLLPHCIAILCDTLTQKLDDIRRSQEAQSAADEKPQDAKKPEEKKLSKSMIIFIAAVLLVAAITPVILVKMIWSNEDASTTVNPLLTSSSGAVSQVQPTSSAFPGVDNANATTAGNAGTTAKEPTATEYSAQPTAAPAPSTSGKFTFYVFGYGHGVGMSQHGANYLASQGWNYAQILANYYYGTTLVTGDTYPDTIKYNGSDYKTREYLASALESEMGSSFHKEALKAQAVALYTFAKYYNYTLGTDSNAFGKTPSQACYDAVDEVMKYGLYIAYNGTEAALTPFHSISAGLTTSFYNVWGKTAVPYLGGGRPSYGDYSVDGFKSTYSISSDDLKKIIKEKLSVDVSGDPSTWITVISHDRAVNENVGYISSINVGGKVISGNDFRTKVMEGKIRSHCFMLVYTPDGQ